MKRTEQSNVISRAITRCTSALAHGTHSYAKIRSDLREIRQILRDAKETK